MKNNNTTEFACEITWKMVVHAVIIGALGRDPRNMMILKPNNKRLSAARVFLEHVINMANAGKDYKLYGMRSVKEICMRTEIDMLKAEIKKLKEAARKKEEEAITIRNSLGECRITWDELSVDERKRIEEHILKGGSKDFVSAMNKLFNDAVIYRR